MKCPKCGFNSFEYLDSCKKCNSDLSAFKQSLGIQAIILPAAQASTALAAEPAVDLEAAGQDIASWDNPVATGETPAFDDGFAPAEEAAETEFSFSDNAPPAGSFAPTQTETFGEFSFDDMNTQPPPPQEAAPAEPASSWTGGSEFAATDFPGFADEPATAPAQDDRINEEEAKPAKQQKPPADDLFSSDDFADLFKDDEPGK